MLAAHNREASDTNVGDVQSAVQDKHISSEENGFPKSLEDKREIKVLLEKETSNEDPKSAKSSYAEAHGSHQSHLSSGDPIGAENTASMQVHNNELAVANLKKGGSSIGKSDDDLEKEAPHLHLKTDLQIPEDLSLSSMHTPQRRPRSSSPGATLENLNKRPAIICDFFARGWCIKGNSCRFLHQKEGTKEDLAGPSGKADILDGTGSREEAERLKLSASQELPDSSNTESSSKSQFHVHRALVRAYGGESHGLPQFHDDYNSRAGEEVHRVDIPHGGRTLVREEYKSPFGVSPHFDSMDQRQSASEHFLSRRYLNEGKLQWEIPKGEFLNDAPFSRGSSLTLNSLVPEYRYYSGGSSASSSLFHNSNNPFAYDRRTEDLAIRNQQSNFPLHGSYSSYSSTGSLNSSFRSYLPAPVSPSVHTFSQAGTSSTRGSTPLSAEHLDTHKTLDFDRGYYDSRSSSLPRSSSPYFSRPEVENIRPHNIPRDLPASVGQRSQNEENTWEPSVPFQPSFYCAPASVSSPGSQYDPLLDSMEPPNTGNIAFQATDRTVIQNVSSHSINGDPLLYGSHTAGYNVQKPLSSFPRPHEGILANNTPAHGLSGQTTVVAATGPSTVDGGYSSVPKEEKLWIPDHLAESANVNDAELGGNLINQVDKGRIIKESKALKIFRAALVEFVKELVRPSWREGHLSKDAHKMIVKKAVEKVLGALQPHQVPSTTESINQYLSTSRPKLLKLVEGYVDKYAKS